MKLLSKSILLFSTLLVLSSCGKDDDDPGCNRDSWLGTYTGSTVCDDPDGNETLSITITAGSEANEIIIDSGDGDPTSSIISGCDIPETEVEIDFSGIVITVTASGGLDGNTITLNSTTVTTGGGQSETDNCVTTLTKQ